MFWGLDEWCDNGANERLLFAEGLSAQTAFAYHLSI
jgi:hypothetical protein